MNQIRELQHMHYPFFDSIETVVTFFILIFSYFSAAIILSLLILRYRKIRFNKKCEVLRTEVTPWIMNASFANTDEELKEITANADKAFRTAIRSPAMARTVINEVMGIQRTLSGSAKTNLTYFFLNTVLIKYVLRRLKSDSWYIKAMAIQEVAEMGLEDYADKIQKYTTSNNIYLQEVAQTSMVHLNGYKGLDFLSKLENPISDWQQINLFDSLKYLDKDLAPDFSVWLTSKEDTVKLFAIRLIHFFQQEYNISKLHDLLTHENIKIREAVITALNRFEPEALKTQSQ